MTEQAVNYDDVKQYRLDPEREEELRRTGGECTFIWANKSGHPLGVTTAYVPVGDKIWMTATRERVRIKAIARDGRSSIVITSKGTPMGGGKTVTYKGHTVIHDDRETKLWMYRLLAAGLVEARSTWLQRIPGRQRLLAPLIRRRVRAFIDRIHNVFDRLDQLPVTTIAVTHGVVFGGGFELALTADVIIAEQGARFAFPELRLGLVPGFGGIPRLERDLGMSIVQ